MLHGLLERELGEFVLVLLGEFPHRGWGHPRVLPQGPPDGLANKELLLMTTTQAKLEQQRLVSLPLVAQLVDDGSPPQPHVVIWEQKKGKKKKKRKRKEKKEKKKNKKKS